MKQLLRFLLLIVPLLTYVGWTTWRCGNMKIDYPSWISKAEAQENFGAQPSAQQHVIVDSVLATIPVSQASVAVQVGTVTAFVANTPAVIIASTLATVPVSVPTIGMVIVSALATIPVNVAVSVGTVTAFVANTPAVLIQGTPAIQGSVSINNTPGVLIQGTIGVAIQNTPAVLPAAALANATTTATTLPNVQITPATLFPVINLGYDSTASNNAYRAMGVDASGNLGANVKNTPAVLIQGTPAVQGSVSINNTPGVLVQGTIGVAVQNTPAVQGSVSINNTPGVLVQGTIGVAVQNTPGVLVQGTIGVAVQNTPAVQAAAALAAATTTATTLPNVQITPATIFPMLQLGYDSTASNNAYRAVAVDASGNLGANVKNTPAVLIQGTPAVQGSVSINNTPAVQGSVSIMNTPAVQGSVSIMNTVAIATPTYQVNAFLGNTPAIQGSVSINNTPAMVIASALATVPVAVPTIGVVIASALATVPVSESTQDPCQSDGIVKLSVKISISSATGTCLVASVAAQKIHVCGFAFTLLGTPTPGLQFVSASNTPCANQTPITGTWNGGVSHPGGYDEFDTGSGNSLCAVVTGAGSDAEGILTYVIQ